MATIRLARNSMSPKPKSRGSRHSTMSTTSQQSSPPEPSFHIHRKSTASTSSSRSSASTRRREKRERGGVHGEGAATKVEKCLWYARNLAIVYGHGLRHGFVLKRHE
ncbi:hypothetical protein BP6252_02088 [Coleophoma cylindrospora]|uniref:Uncharacterized protein n=1 Tax=Coleophoma cylindrospora TaxID=1849047 RepID=A0A3D8SFG2_9HELO|nr:hypothetical protein BP6252_02088 [Coleophoma cylindrospora]